MIRSFLFICCVTGPGLLNGDKAFATTPVVPAIAASVPQAAPVDVLSAFFALEDPPSAHAFLSGQQVAIAAEKEFVKFSVGFAKPTRVGTVKLESCNGEFVDSVEGLFYPGLRRAFAEGGKAFVKIKVPEDRPVTALTLVLNHLSPNCLKGFELLDIENRPVRLNVPFDESAQFDGDETRRLFDQNFRRAARFATGLASVVNFDAEQSIDRLYVWNGDQLSAAAFAASTKISKLSIVSDSARAPRAFELTDHSGVQVVEFDPPITGRKLTFKPQSAGSISELRFGTGSDATTKVYGAISTSSAIESDLVSRAFRATSVEAALDRDLTTREESRPWNFRFRGDSSFFVYGYDDGENRRGRFNAIGRFEVLGQEPKKLRLRLRGTRLAAPNLWDGWFCGLGCGEVESRSDSMIDETIVLEKLPAGVFMLRNRNAASKRTLPFGDLKTKVSTLSE